MVIVEEEIRNDRTIFRDPIVTLKTSRKNFKLKLSLLMTLYIRMDLIGCQGFYHSSNHSESDPKILSVTTSVDIVVV